MYSNQIPTVGNGKKKKILFCYLFMNLIHNLKKNKHWFVFGSFGFMLRSETGHENRVIIVTTATLVPMVAYCIHFFFAPDTSGGLPGHQQGEDDTGPGSGFSQVAN